MLRLIAFVLAPGLRIGHQRERNGNPKTDSVFDRNRPAEGVAMNLGCRIDLNRSSEKKRQERKVCDLAMFSLTGNSPPILIGPPICDSRRIGVDIFLAPHP